MIYIINDTLVYDSDNATISLVTAPKIPEHSLTTINNRLLKLLLDNKGVVLSKEECLDNVWEKYGQEGSVNTLTQYVSNLRKIFAFYLIDEEFIVTVPRKGYMVSSEVVVTIGALDNISVDSDVSVPAPVKPKKLDKLDLFFVLIMLGLIGGILPYLLKAKISSQVKPVLLFSNGTCPVYAFEKSSNEQEFEYRKKISKLLIDEHKLSCLPSTSFFVSINKGAEHGISGNVMLARCVEHASTQNSCITYRYNRW